MAADMDWAAQVREMLEHDRVQLVYQPSVSTTDGTVLDYEVLVRMICDDGQIILPGGFMPAAERFGLIHSVDRWNVNRAIRQLASLHEHGHRASFTINLSGKAFEDSTLLPLIQKSLDDTGLDPTWVTFEITETAAIANLSAAEEFISALKDIGCQFALDDFGCGFSSFAYLKHLPVDKLKIDGSFVKGMAHSSVDQALVESMNQVAHALGKLTVAECVENEETMRLLKDMGIDLAQGNYLGRPGDVPVSLIQPEPPAGAIAGVVRLRLSMHHPSRLEAAPTWDIARLLLLAQEGLAMYRDVQVPREAGEGEDAERPRDWPGPSQERPGANRMASESSPADYFSKPQL